MFCLFCGFFFVLRPCPPSFWIPSLANEPGGQGFLGTAAIYFSLCEPFGKDLCRSSAPTVRRRKNKIAPRRNVFAVKRLQVVLVATTAYCHWEELGNVVLRTVFDNVQEPKLSIKSVPERGGVGVYESILIRVPRFSRAIAACCFHMRCSLAATKI